MNDIKNFLECLAYLIAIVLGIKEIVSWFRKGKLFPFPPKSIITHYGKVWFNSNFNYFLCLFQKQK